MDTLKTFSKFYYGYEVTTENFNLPFQDDISVDEQNAEVSVGSYTLTDFLLAVQTALNSNSAQVFTVTVNRSTRIVTIASNDTFDLLPVTGVFGATSVFPILGFTTDRSGGTSYSGDVPAGSVFEPQFRLQNYVPLEHWTGAALATVNKAASGRVEVIKFGNESFMQASIPYITDTPQQDENIIKSNVNGVDNILSFLNYAITKGPMEFMPDEDDESIFYKLILESTLDDKDGTSFKLSEMYDKGLPGFYDTGILKFRQVED